MSTAFFVIRMLILYPFFIWLASQGIGTMDEGAGTFTVNIDSLTELLIGLGGYALTFVTSRISKRKGGAT